MSLDIFVPVAGESVVEADIVEWKKSDGDYVEMDEAIVELETDKASMDLTAESAGILTILVKEGTVKVGDKLGFITESKEKPAAAKPAQAAPVVEKVAVAPAVKAAAEKQIVQATYAKGVPSPSAAKLMAENQISAETVKGTGKNGRITKEDVKQSAGAKAAPGAEAPKKAAPAPKGSRTERRERMSRLRKTVAQRLVNAQHTAALLTTFNEVDMTEVMAIRKKYKEVFREKYQVGLGFTSFFTKAVCSAIEEYPIMNAAIDGDEIVYRDFVDIGIAVSTPKGLVVPVIRNAEGLTFQGIEATVLDYGRRGRDGKLTMEDMEGGTFTITNGGVFGSMLSTPIVNFPQSAILGLHNIVERPVAVGGEMVIRPIMYLAITYDHRLIDGADAVRFLVGIKQRIEDPTRLLIGL